MIRPVWLHVSYASLKLSAVVMHTVSQRASLMSAMGTRGWWVCLCQHCAAQVGKSLVPPSKTVTCLTLYLYLFSTCYVSGQPQLPSAVDQTVISLSSLRHKLTKRKASPRTRSTSACAFTGLIFKKAASSWSCGGELGHNATLKPFFCLPLTTSSTIKRQSGFVSGYS